jgi:hypothetical protein
MLLGSFKGTTKEEKYGKEPEVFRKINSKLKVNFLRQRVQSALSK